MVLRRRAILTQHPCAGLTLLAAAERTTDRRAERDPSVRSQQKLALGRILAILSVLVLQLRLEPFSTSGV
jgi:hypothetical protein